MAFKFQINDDVDWQIDENLLQKAKDNMPEIYHETVIPERIVEIVEDTDKLGGVSVKESSSKIYSLSDTTYNRGTEVIFDLGDHYVGRFSIDIDSVGSPMDAPLTLKITFAEVPSELTSDSAKYDGWLSSSWIQEELVHIDELPIRLNLPRRYAARFIRVSVLDTSPKWRAKFTNPVFNAESSVKMNDVTLKETGNVQIDNINVIATKTLLDCMQEIFEDGPKRDRRLWLGDLRLQALANYETFNNTTLVKRSLYLFGGMTAKDGRIPANVFTKPNLLPDDTFLFDYSVFFGVVLSDYFDRTSDWETLTDLYDVAKKQMDYAFKFVDENGCLSLPEEYPAFIDWSNDFDKTTAAQGTLIFSLKKFIQLSVVLHDQDYQYYEDMLKKLSDYAIYTLYDSEKVAFISGEDGEINIASQVWMIIAEIMDQATNQKIIQEMIDTQFPVSGIATPYMYHHIVEAMFIAGISEEAIKLMQEYWGKMVDLGADTFWEAFEPENTDYSPYGDPIVSSFCHAWSCTPVYLTSKYI